VTQNVTVATSTALMSVSCSGFKSRHSVIDYVVKCEQRQSPGD